MILRLGYFGLLPFLLLPLFVVIPRFILPSLAADMFITYSVCIAAFMAGTLWGREIDKPSPKPYVLLVSNGIALCIVAFALIADIRVVGALIGLMLVHLMNLVGEREKHNVQYYILRKRLTIVTILSHALMITLLLWSPNFE
ncbi:DUF3429 domain-containing protein [Vibrio kasasachensis]|uniref:DUF3429 family protein n=1 Tax=Vibrio kasasachensis TaxID=2910248 RepID=UPI003D0A0016